MSIAFESEEVELKKLRDRLRGMSDDELLRFGKASRNLCRDRDWPEMFERQLQEARTGWRRGQLVQPSNFNGREMCKFWSDFKS